MCFLCSRVTCKQGKKNILKTHNFQYNSSFINRATLSIECFKIHFEFCLLGKRDDLLKRFGIFMVVHAAFLWCLRKREVSKRRLKKVGQVWYTYPTIYLTSKCYMVPGWRSNPLLDISYHVSKSSPKKSDVI